MSLSSPPFRKRATKWRASWLGGRKKKKESLWLRLAKKDGRLGNQTEATGYVEHRPHLINISEPEIEETPAYRVSD